MLTRIDWVRLLVFNLDDYIAALENQLTRSRSFLSKVNVSAEEARSELADIKLKHASELTAQCSKTTAAEQLCLDRKCELKSAGEYANYYETSKADLEVELATTRVLLQDFEDQFKTKLASEVLALPSLCLPFPPGCFMPPCVLCLWSFPFMFLSHLALHVFAYCPRTHHLPCLRIHEAQADDSGTCSPFSLPCLRSLFLFLSVIPCFAGLTLSSVFCCLLPWLY